MLLALLVLLGCAATAVDVLYRFPNLENSRVKDAVRITVPKGIGPRGLADLLGRAGLTTSPGRFALWIRLTGGMLGIKAGEFEVRRDLTPKEIVTVLSGRTLHKGIRVLIPEGFTLSRIAHTLAAAKIVDQEAFLSAATDAALVKEMGIPGATFEGYLFPDTYYFDQGTSAERIIAAMVDNFNAKVALLHIPRERLHDTVILASIVQAETAHADEMPIVAGVYRNRLDDTRHPSRRLQADPTVAFGCEPYIRPQAPSCATFQSVLKRNQLDDPVNPYNTYRHPGLPPGPISAPGLAALEAAAFPTAVPFLYFVAAANGNGRHVFSTTLAEHEAAVRAYRNRAGASE
jgi:UPF0755 protein